MTVRLRHAASASPSPENTTALSTPTFTAINHRHPLLGGPCARYDCHSNNLSRGVWEALYTSSILAIRSAFSCTAEMSSSRSQRSAIGLPTGTSSPSPPSRRATKPSSWDSTSSRTWYRRRTQSSLWVLRRGSIMCGLEPVNGNNRVRTSCL